MYSKKIGVALSLYFVACAAHATDLLDVWQAASKVDPDVAIAQLERSAGQYGDAQAKALWRPSVVFNAGTSLMNASTEISGASFSAPAFGSLSGASFNTDIDKGVAFNWRLAMRQPIFNLERRAQAQQMQLGVNASELSAQLIQQNLLLRSAQNYFAVVVAQHKLDLLNQQHAAVIRTLTEAKDRFTIGDAPVTGIHEASAKERALAAEVVAIKNELTMAKLVLSDATGLPVESIQPSTLNALNSLSAENQLPSLDEWLALAQSHNLQLQLQKINLDVAQQNVKSVDKFSALSLDLVAEANSQSINGRGDVSASAKNTQDMQMLGLQVQMPLYSGGMRSARFAQAQQVLKKTEAELTKSRQQINQQIQSAWLNLQSSKAQIEALNAALVASRSRLNATSIGRQVGDRTSLDQINAENDLAAIALQLMQAKVALVMNQLQLNALAGQLDAGKLAQINTFCCSNKI